MDNTLPADFAALPAGTLIQQGLEDLQAGHESVASLLVQIGAPRLRLSGVALPAEMDSADADQRLYRLLAARHGPEAHSQFNSWIRQLVSFERALERRVWSRRRQTAAGLPSQPTTLGAEPAAESRANQQIP